MGVSQETPYSTGPTGFDVGDDGRVACRGCLRPRYKRGQNTTAEDNTVENLLDFRAFAHFNPTEVRMAA